MMIRVERVHNAFEAMALIKEATERFDAEKYDGTEWRTHEGASLFVTKLFQGRELTRWRHTPDGLVKIERA